MQSDVKIAIKMVGVTATEKYKPLLIRMSGDICDARLFHIAVFTGHSVRHDNPL
jgi:hypothetical protein